jgi:putative membrane protein insertion efficiency factor
MMEEMNHPVATRLCLAVICLYKRGVSPALPSACRFQPTCSQYAYEAIERFGVRRGGWLALRRLLRCTPLTQPGYDPVPERVSRETPASARLASEEA